MASKQIIQNQSPIEDSGGRGNLLFAELPRHTFSERISSLHMTDLRPRSHGYLGLTLSYRRGQLETTGAGVDLVKIALSAKVGE